MKTVLLVLLSIVLLLTGTHDAAHAGHRVGGGIHYLRTLGDIKDAPGFDENAVGFMGSYQFTLPLLRFEGDVEWIPDFGGSDKSLWQPQAWVLVGSLIYGSAGIGIGYIDGDWQDNPFYALRVGTDISLFGLNLDAFATYRFQNAKVFEEYESDDLNSITFGAIVRFSR